MACIDSTWRASDLAFRSTIILGPLNNQLNCARVLSVKADQDPLPGPPVPAATGPDCRLAVLHPDGTILRAASRGKNAARLYGKLAIVPRIETITNDISDPQKRVAPRTNSL
jgi:hypothetical protein